MMTSSSKDESKTEFDTEEFMRRTFEPHLETLAKLMQVKKAKTKKKVLQLKISS